MRPPPGWKRVPLDPNLEPLDDVPNDWTVNPWFVGPDGAWLDEYGFDLAARRDAVASLAKVYDPAFVRCELQYPWAAGQVWALCYSYPPFEILPLLELGLDLRDAGPLDRSTFDDLRNRERASSAADEVAVQANLTRHHYIHARLPKLKSEPSCDFRLLLPGIVPTRVVLEVKTLHPSDLDVVAFHLNERLRFVAFDLIVEGLMARVVASPELIQRIQTPAGLREVVAESNQIVAAARVAAIECRKRVPRAGLTVDFAPWGSIRYDANPPWPQGTALTDLLPGSSTEKDVARMARQLRSARRQADGHTIVLIEAGTTELANAFAQHLHAPAEFSPLVERGVLAVLIGFAAVHPGYVVRRHINCVALAPEPFRRPLQELTNALSFRAHERARDAAFARRILPPH